MSFARRLGLQSHDPKVKLPDIPVLHSRSVRDAGSSHSVDLALVGRLQADLKAANAKIAELEAALVMARTGNAVTLAASTVTKHGNALTPAEKQRAYRERQKAKKAAMSKHV